MPQYRLIYFNGKGRAESARLLFAYAGVSYEDVRISREEWSQLKSSAPFGQLPILEADGKILPQSKAIGRYLAKQFGLIGKNDFETALCDSLVDGSEEFTNKIVAKFDESDSFQKKKISKDYDTTIIKPHLNRYEKFLQQNKTGFFVGNQITWADFWIYHDVVSSCSHLISEYKCLQQFVKKIEDLPAIKKWLKSRPNTRW